MDEALAAYHYRRAVAMAGSDAEGEAAAADGAAGKQPAEKLVLDPTLEKRPVAATAAALLFRAALWRLHAKQQWRSSGSSAWLAWLGAEPELAASGLLALVLGCVFVIRNQARAPRLTAEGVGDGGGGAEPS